MSDGIPQTGDEATVSISGKLAMVDQFNRQPDGELMVQLVWQDGRSITKKASEMEDYLE